MRINQVVGACCGISMLISLGYMMPDIECMPVLGIDVPILSYGLLSLVFEIISLCGINFILLFFLVDKINNKKDKSVIIRFCFMSFFIVLFCIGNYLDNLERVKYIPICMLLPYDVNTDAILSFFITFFLLIDTIILDRCVKKNESK